MKVPTWRKVLVPILIVTSSILFIVFIGQSVANGIYRHSLKSGGETTELSSEDKESKDETASSKTTADKEAESKTEKSTDKKTEEPTEEVTEEVTEEATEEQLDEGSLLVAQAKEYLYGFGEDGYDQNKAIECLDQAIELGNADAWYYRGEAYERTDALDRYEQANACYDKAIELESPLGYVGKGDLYFYGNGVDVDYEQAKYYYDCAIGMGCLNANTRMGIMYAYGYGVEQDDETAMNHYKAALTSDDPFTLNYAYCQVGKLYESGYNGAEPDYENAVKYYKKASDNGYRVGMLYIGDICYYGRGRDVDYEKALKYYKKAANLGQISAMNMIGVMYYNGSGLEQDLESAVKWYNKAASLGNATSMGNLSWCYYNGDGTEVDYAKSMEWAQNALVGGEPEGYFRVAWLYDEGLGVEENDDTALDYYMKYVDATNNPVAMWNMYCIYSNRGELDAARSWAERGLAAATEQGNQTYIDKFNEQLSQLP
ncbi:MAG: SEL1-like repeat protein [Lachnospiraceae bacterium]|nr:SEL1-like repeat protein [Lachnospiraceae bacterium]